MNTYGNFISQFEIVDYRRKSVDGYCWHHIVPRVIQKQQGITDDRVVLLTPAQHFWAHILYDREHNTKTCAMFLTLASKSINDIQTFDDCLCFNDIYVEQQAKAKGISWSEDTQFKKGHTPWNKGQELPDITKQRMKANHKGTTGCHWPDETRQKIAEGNKGKHDYIKGSHWWNNGQQNRLSKECPGPGFSLGRL